MKLCKHCTPRRLSLKLREDGRYVHSLPCDFCDSFGRSKKGKDALIAGLDRFTRHYIIAALWSSHDNSDPSGGDPLDYNYGIEDLTVTALLRIKKDCEKFQYDNSRALSLVRYPQHSFPDGHYTDVELAGHDFWLTRNGHGVGFWDRGLRLGLGEILTKASHKFRETYLYVQGGKIHCE